MYLTTVAQFRGGPDRRSDARIGVQCRARILIGTRHYAGYLHDISPDGARLRTISPIRKVGAVLLQLPDMPLLRCRLRWADAYHAGIKFELPLSKAELDAWVSGRLRVSEQPQTGLADLVELAD